MPLRPLNIFAPLVMAYMYGWHIMAYVVTAYIVMAYFVKTHASTQTYLHACHTRLAHRRLLLCLTIQAITIWAMTQTVLFVLDYVTHHDLTFHHHVTKSRALTTLQQPVFVCLSSLYPLVTKVCPSSPPMAITNMP